MDNDNNNDNNDNDNDNNNSYNHNNDSNNDNNDNDNDNNNSNNHNNDSNNDNNDNDNDNNNSNNDNNDSNNSIIIGNTIKLIYTISKYQLFDENCSGSAFLSFSILNKHKKKLFLIFPSFSIHFFSSISFLSSPCCYLSTTVIISLPFRNGMQAYYESLKTVLVAASHGSGYCQGLNFLAALFLLSENEKNSFSILSYLLKQKKLGILFDSNCSSLLEYMNVFSKRYVR